MVFGFGKKKDVKEEKPVEVKPKRSLIEMNPPVVVKSREELESVGSNKEIIDIISKVKDPELDMDIWSLGLIYDIKTVNKEEASITMTFTSPLCPFGPQIVQEIKDGLEGVGFKRTEINVVIEPRWEPSEEVRAILGF